LSARLFIIGAVASYGGDLVVTFNWDVCLEIALNSIYEWKFFPISRGERESEKTSRWKLT
jgi:hypothetical protein